MSRSMAPAGVAAAGLVALLLGIVPSWWFVGGVKLGPDQSPDRVAVALSFGLTAVEACSAGACTAMTYRALPAPDPDPATSAVAGRLRRFVWAGATTFWGGVVVSIAIGGALLVWLRGRRLPVSPSILGAALAIGVAGAALIAWWFEPTLPQLSFLHGELDLHLGPGLPLTLLGCAGCAIGGLLLARDERRDPATGAAAAIATATAAAATPVALAASLTPACPRCHAPTIFVAEHQRHFCSSCRAYL